MTLDLIPWLLTSSLLLSVWAIWNVLSARQWMRDMRHELDVLSLACPPVKPDDVRVIAEGPPGLECVIRLHDPVQVAKQESRMAKRISGIAPHLLSREVYRQVKEETVLLLEKRNIEADVQVRVR